MIENGDHGDLAGALDWIDPAALGYDEWLAVGMGLHDSGLPLELWDDWSRRDPRRYVEGECARKWAGFGDGDGRVTSGTVAKMARDRGWVPPSEDRGYALEWDGEVDLSIVNPAWVEDADFDCGEEWDAAGDLRRYIEALFDPEDTVGYAVESAKRDGRYVPASAGVYTRTAGEILDALARTGDVRAALGDYDERAGAWFRLNPLDGHGVKNANVAEFRYALVESDSIPKERQLALIRAIELPCAVVVDSGNKSLHAIVRVDARDRDQYRERVDRLYEVCRKNGLEPDAQNRNPSRLTRVAGVVRGGEPQRIVSGPCGKSSWAEWWEWVQETTDDLPEDTNSDWDEPIRLAPPLIGTEGDGVLRCGQKMVVAGPSKAGKSFALIDLAEAIACGGTWLGWRCRKGPVYYVNLEIADESFRNRQHIVWADREAHCDTGDGIESVKENFVRLDLRGHAAELSKLVPCITRRMLKRGPRGHFAAIIIDPIYKVNGGDENDAAAISAFTNQLDVLARSLGCAIIYAHHFVKGAAGERASMDRMSGSGVFARDADAIVSLSPLYVPEGMRDRLAGAGAWRLEATLREFREPDPINLLFKFPRFYLDDTGFLARFDVEGMDRFAKINDAKKRQAARDQEDRVEWMRRAIAECEAEGIPPTRDAVLERMERGRDDGDVTATMLKNWTTGKAKWSPIRCRMDGDEWVLYDTMTACLG